MRVYARLFDIGTPLKTATTKKHMERLAKSLLPVGKARLFNQALMDFGGLVCLPRSPRCHACVLAERCRALQNDTVAIRPIPSRPATTIEVKMATGILAEGGRLFIQQRMPDDVWGGLWEFPGGRLKSGETPEDAVVREYFEETGFRVRVCGSITTVIHSYTRYRVTLHCFGCQLLNGQTTPRLAAAQAYRWLAPDDLRQYGFPAGHRKILEFIAASCPELLYDPCRLPESG